MTIEKIVQLGKYPVANGSLFETTRFQMQLLYVPVGFQIHMLQIEFFLALPSMLFTKNKYMCMSVI